MGLWRSFVGLLVAKYCQHETQIIRRELLPARCDWPIRHADGSRHANACDETEEGQQAVKEEISVVGVVD